MLRKAVYPILETILNRLALKLDAYHITPNQLTLAGLLINFLAGLIFATGHLILGSLVLLVASFGDLLDGPLARSTGKETTFGAFLDSTVDRYSDFFIFGGLAFYFARHGNTLYFLLLLGILGGAFVTSYSKARAESLIKHCNVGLLERAERILLVLIGALIPPLLPYALWILFIGTHATALQRILHTRKILSKDSA